MTPAAALVIPDPPRNHVRLSDGSTITARQQQILSFIQTSIAITGVPPTRAEISAEFGFKSANAAEDHLCSLERRGCIELVRGVARGIRLTQRSKDSQALGQRDFNFIDTQIALPLVHRVAAGSPVLAQEHIVKTYFCDRSLFVRLPDYLLKVRGMSMRDSGIADSDLLAVQATRDAKNGQIIVARVGDEITVKRFRRNKHLIELHPDNPDYQTIVIEPGEPFEVEGIAVGLIRNTMLF